eukprot:3327104-Alexandrium_andersonii.AAC.1
MLASHSGGCDFEAGPDLLHGYLAATVLQSHAARGALEVLTAHAAPWSSLNPDAKPALLSFDRRAMYSSRCTIGLQAAASTFERLRAVSCAPQGGATAPQTPPKSASGAPEVLLWGVQGGR